jgi:hypothetical protein
VISPHQHRRRGFLRQPDRAKLSHLKRDTDGIVTTLQILAQRMGLFGKAGVDFAPARPNMLGGKIMEMICY